jgi:hypothetical protein
MYISAHLPQGSHTGAGGPTASWARSGEGSGRPRVSAHSISSGESREVPSHPPFTGLSPASQPSHANRGLDHRCYVTPLIGAYIADAHLGRYNTIIIAVFIGHIILIVSAVPGVIEKSQTTLGVFLFTQIVMGFGTGLFKVNISRSLQSNHCTKLFVVETKSGKRVIVDLMLTVLCLYMYFYLFINIGALVGQVTMAYSEKVCLLFYFIQDTN